MKKNRKNCTKSEQVDIQPVHLLPEDAYPFAADSTGEGDPDVVQGYIQNEESEIQPDLSSQKEQLDDMDSDNPDSSEATYLRNKNVVILEATSAIGLAIAEDLSQLGCRLFICSHVPMKLEETFSKIRISYPETTIFGISCDNTKETVERALTTACSQLGCIDIVINNITVDDSLPIKSNWQEDNFLPRYFNCVFSALPIMARQSSGFILNILPILAEDNGTKCLASAIKAFSSALNDEVDSLGITIEVLHPDDQALENAVEMEKEEGLSKSVARRAVDKLYR